MMEYIYLQKKRVYEIKKWKNDHMSDIAEQYGDINYPHTVQQCHSYDHF